MLRHHFELCRMLINEILDDEVTSPAGERYKHDRSLSNRYNRWGYIPGSVRLNDEKLRMDVTVYMILKSRRINLWSYINS
jgi:putative transposase